MLRLALRTTTSSIHRVNLLSTSKSSRYSIDRFICKKLVCSHLPLVSAVGNVHRPNSKQSVYLTRRIHTSNPLQVPPLVWIIARPIAQVIVALGGRKARNWWKSQSTEEREKFWKKYGWTLYSGLATLLGSFGLYYYAHLQEAPYTKRKRFMLFNDKQLQILIDYEKEAVFEELKDKGLPSDHDLTVLVADIMRLLLNANKDVENIPKQWFVCVVDDPSIKNAYCLPSGIVVVYTGLLSIMENSQQLAAVLSHEMAHVVLRHGAEQLSFAQFIDYIIILIMASLWTLLPGDGIAIVSQWFYKKVVNLVINLPYSRALEREADEVGLTLMAKACFDVREFSRFWRIMHANESVLLDLKLQAEATAQSSAKSAPTTGNQLLNGADGGAISNQLVKSLASQLLTDTSKLSATTTTDKQHDRVIVDVVPPSNQSNQAKQAVEIAEDYRYKVALGVEALLNTHPASHHREEFINQRIPEALALRRECKCCELSAEDPRDSPINYQLLKQRAIESQKVQ